MTANTPSNDASGFHQGMRWVAAIELSMFGLLWVSFGVGAFVWICTNEIETNRRKEQIRRGEVKPIALRVLAIAPADKVDAWRLQLGDEQVGKIGVYLINDPE